MVGFVGKFSETLAFGDGGGREVWRRQGWRLIGLGEKGDEIRGFKCGGEKFQS